ncbi:MAG: GNAT family N-acetyltransferase [Chloroflexi bacterium]|nr:GNAT family N-acetyltransferase [Chloroflexota bacterium]
MHPAYRRQGLGERLLRACEVLLDVPRVRLSVRAGNAPAIRLYERLGYRQVQIWPRYYAGGEDGLVMEKERS